MPPHNIILGAVGGLILWFGWYGFNPGSTLSALDAPGHRPGVVQHHDGRLLRRPDGAVHLLLPHQKWDLGLTVNGFLAAWSPSPARATGSTRSARSSSASIGARRHGRRHSTLLEYLRIDDPIGAVPVHMFAGIWRDDVARPVRRGRVRRSDADRRRHHHVVTGLFYGGGVAPARGSRPTARLASRPRRSPSPWSLMYAVKATGTLRVSEEGELEGLDLHEHGASGYPEFVVSRGMSMFGLPPNAPQGMPVPAATLVPGASTSNISSDH